MEKEVYTWHWSGFRFHLECLPDESQLSDEAKKEMGKKPDKMTDAIWALMLQDCARKIMTQCFYQEFSSISGCCACDERRGKAEKEGK